MAVTKGVVPVHECHYRCDPGKHRSNLTAAVTKASLSDEKVAAYLKWCCVKYANAVDSNGRSVLHMAASTGRLKFLRFLLNHKNININCKDHESCFAPLHRSLFYGQLHCAVRLIQAGANIAQNDADDLTPLDHVMKDRPSMLEYDTKQPCEVYVWGTNTYYNLGIGHNNSRANPEPLAFFRKHNISVKKAFMSKFHSLFIGSDGKVWVCGLGSGGRLGLGDEETILVPKALKIGNTSSDTCKAASVGVNHTLLLLENGSVWSFGSNNYHQLGHSPPPEEVPSPKAIKSLRGLNIIGISAAKFHSVFWTKNQLFTCGLHGGQLGHLPSNERTIIVPKVVTSLQLKTSTIEHVATSDGAMVVVSSKLDFYLFRDYQCKRMRTSKRFLPTKKICILGGHLDHKVYSSSLQEKGGDDLKILILAENNNIYLWQESYQQTTLCLLSLHRYINVTDMVLNRTSLLLTTKDGEAFMGQIKIKKRKSLAENDKPLSPKGNEKCIDVDDCDYIKLKRIPHVHRGVSIASDLKGRNFAVIQTHPKSGILIPYIESTDMKRNMKTLLETASEYDTLHDVVFDVGGTRYPAHRYVVSYSSDVLREMIDNSNSNNGVPLVKIDNIQPQIFERVLSYLYTGECDLQQVGACPLSFDPGTEAVQEVPHSFEQMFINKEEVSAFEHHKQQRSSKRKSASKTTKSKMKDPVNALKDASRVLGLSYLTKHLDSLVYDNGYIRRHKPCNIKLTPPKFSRKSLDNLWDISLRAEDGTIIKAHKCILVARLEYFNCMINNGWLESSLKAPLNLTIPSTVLEVLIRYLYTDEVPELMDSYDTDLASHVLVIADEFFCTRLKEIAEVSLSNMITLKIAAEMLQLAVTYNAKQLKECAMEFICLNLPALLESRSLDILDDSLLTDLRDFYRSWLPCMKRRCITVESNEPSDDLVNKIYETEPVSLDKVEEDSPETKPTPKTPKDKSQRKKRNSESERIRNTSIGSITSDEELLNSMTNKLSDSFGSDETWIKVTSHGSKPQAKAKVPANENSTPKTTAVVRTLNFPVPHSTPVKVVRPPVPVKKESLSDLENDFVLLTSTSDREFPALGSSLPERTVTGPKSPNEISKKFVKLSQKQRKKLATQSLSQEETTPPPKSAEEVKSVWGIGSRMDTQTMADVMKETKSSKQSPLASSPSWQASSSPECSLSAIMAAERHQREMIARMKSKPLEYTQMEDKAIDDLTLLYDISNVTDERITIRRADSFAVSPPVWVSNNR
ncbi:hypothetical protein RUM44_009195 [Polyplax serrata]|uniref:BTB domain-containing protein n=1 Tax=Polyplax serrata TaxID=468196 RepID=A0ABR1AS05_POLSC